MTYYQQWQLEKYGNILPNSDQQPDDEQDSVLGDYGEPLCVPDGEQQNRKGFQLCFRPLAILLRFINPSI